MTLSWEVERVLSLKILNIDGSIDSFVHLGQICRGGGQKFKVVFIFPQNIPRFALCGVYKKNFPVVLLSF